VRVGDLIVVAGTAPIAGDGTTAGIGDPVVQFRRCLEIVEAALQAAGASMADVVRTRILLVNIRDWPLVARVHGEAFASIRPACTVMQVGAFIDPSWLVEVEVDAVAPA
jgi:enamine deaminase RidA (YjgF/YER057c/UK114 family)